jgi:hypothetical protein
MLNIELEHIIEHLSDFYSEYDGSFMDAEDLMEKLGGAFEAIQMAINMGNASVSPCSLDHDHLANPGDCLIHD